MGPGISVVIPTKGRAEQIGEVMESLVRQSHPIQELIFVDDSTKDEFDVNRAIISRFVEVHKPSFEIVHVRGRSIGAADARNQGVELAKYEIVSFIDDDVVLDDDYYLEMMKSFSDHRVSGVTGVISNYRPTPLLWTIIQKAFFLTTHSMKKGFMRRSGFPCFLIKADKVTEVEVMSGSNMNYRREVLLHHRFDDRLKGYSFLEDADLSYRISHEHSLVLNPRCILVHNTTVKGVDDRYYQIKLSYHRYIFQKHFSKNPINYIPYALAVIAILADTATTSLVSKDKRYIRAALRGLSRECSIR